MAAPHVTGAWAVIKSKAPDATVDEVLNALINTGHPVYDSRNGITKPRIDVMAAINSLTPPITTIGTTIGGDLLGSYPMGANQYTLKTYPVEGGPVVVSTNNDTNTVASLFQLRRPASTGGWTGIAHLMGIPQEELSDTYVFPYFDATDPTMYNVFTIGNVDTVSTTVSVTIGGVFYDDYDLAPSDALVVRPPLKGGPIVIQSDNSAKIIAQLYELKRATTSGSYNGQSQMTGMQAENLSDTIIIPWYNNILADLSGTIIFANVDTISTTVTVTINGTLYGSYDMAPNTVLLKKYSVEGGPVVVSSSNGANIVASLFQLRRPASTGGWTGIAHLMVSSGRAF